MYAPTRSFSSCCLVRGCRRAAVRAAADPAYLRGRTIENAGHTPLFLLGTLFVLSSCATTSASTDRGCMRWPASSAPAPGLLSEVIQQPLRRDASWEDVFADAVGVVLALALYALFDRRSEFRAARCVAALVSSLGCIAHLPRAAS